MASYYVDPSINANSGTGTIGDPYGDLQYALDSITQDTTNGDRINIKAGTAEILTAELDITTYGTPSFGAGLYFAGYTSTEGDGGVGEIDGNAGGFSVWNKNTVEGIVWDSLIIGNTGTADILYMDRMCGVRNCKIHGTSGNGVRGQVSHWRNWYDDIGTAGVTTSPQGVVDCLFTNGATNSFTVAVQGSFVTRSCFKLSGTSTGVGDGTIIVNNSFYTTGTGNAVDTRSIFSYHYVGNLVQGFTDGLQYDNATEMTPGSYHDNAFYDCTNNVTSADFNGTGYNSGNETLSANLFDLSGSITSFADRLTYFKPVNQGNVYTGMPGGLVKGAVQPAITPLAAKMVKLKHGGMLNPRSLQCLNYSPQLADYQELNSTYTKIAYIGKFHHPQGSGSYDISRVGFYFGGYAVKTGGSGLTVSLQSVDQTQSALTPIGVQEQTVDIANADANFAATTWYRTGTLSSNRTINHGDHVALVIEWDSFGQQGSDFVRFRTVNFVNDDNSSGSFRYNGGTSSWSSYGAAPNCVFEMTDGSFASFSDAFIVDNNFGTYQYDNADSPDEYANSYTPEATVKVDAFCGIFKPPTSEDLDLVIYEGTTAIHTTTVSGWQISLNDNHYWTAELDQEVQLEAHTKYYLALKPTQGTTPCRVYYRSVNDTNHFGIDPYSFGTETAYSRTDGGAWTQIPLRQLMLGVRISSIDNGGTHGAFHPLGGN